ncbi:winged helix-turn-helix domain-containing protein [Spirosoma montaniterrae]|uniref:OmpR/PhoB-type domain-containing protein n=1 Tax=Spirosoma montaniterrae TaxID=1178516 RepID=A0A1P9X0E8_9BACT|nr:winged helix-turn-helix domain-containing protein [Spirosoma montaniterrae]AQG81055.1 hypothetical protein AWR27_18050 [Spirosoma montaniterrae]
MRWGSILFRRLAGGLLLVLAGLLFVRFVRADTHTPRPSEKVNLALRRTAHHLLRAIGDSTSRIQPVQEVNSHTFRLPLNQAFSYDILPELLRDSFRHYQISGNYHVAVLDCATSTLQLGYIVNELTPNEEVPCTGRIMPAGCYALQVSFDASEPTGPGRSGWVLLAGSFLSGLLLIGWPRPRPILPPLPEPTGLADNRLRFGNTVFDVGRQTLVSGSHQHTLTYREAKLLRLFADHANQILDRETILKAVWEDEGITVGRSVDVFVSRLRKLLQHDPSLRIVAIHGIGYRLEVQNET